MQKRLRRRTRNGHAAFRRRTRLAYRNLVVLDVLDVLDLTPTNVNRTRRHVEAQYLRLLQRPRPRNVYGKTYVDKINVAVTGERG